MNYNPRRPSRDEVVTKRHCIATDLDCLPLADAIDVLVALADRYGGHATVYGNADDISFDVIEERVRTDEEYAEAIADWERACERAAIRRLPYVERERIRLQNQIAVAQAALAKLDCN